MPANLGDAEQSTTARPFVLTVQGAIIANLQTRTLQPRRFQMLNANYLGQHGGISAKLGCVKAILGTVTGMKPRLSLQQEPKDPDLGFTPTRSTQEAPNSIGNWDVHGSCAQP